MWKKGDIIQIDPEHDARFGGCLFVVDEPKTWGAQGYVMVPQGPKAAPAYYRLDEAFGRRVGAVVWDID